MASRYYLVFWSRRSTATVVPAATAAQARSRAGGRRKAGYGILLSARQANAADRRLIRKGVWVRRRKDGSSPPVRQHCCTNSGQTPAQPLPPLVVSTLIGATL